MAVTNKLYNIASRINAGTLNTEIGYFPIVGIVIPLAIAYFITASTGLSRVEGCDAVNMKDTRKYFDIALTVALTIPAVVLMQKFIKKDVAFYMMFYGIMGAVTAGLMTEVFEKCKGNETEKTYNGFYLTGFAVVFLLGLLAFLFVR
jgi:O-antigen ligase